MLSLIIRNLLAKQLTLRGSPTAKGGVNSVWLIVADSQAAGQSSASCRSSLVGSVIAMLRYTSLLSSEAVTIATGSFLLSSWNCVHERHSSHESGQSVEIMPSLPPPLSEPCFS